MIMNQYEELNDVNEQHNKEHVEQSYQLVHVNCCLLCSDWC